ncbi:hypothetical protein ISG33_15365 [Glaciecola sp. MH2013]|uniref:inner membrane protein YiaA n=1 Tax=Glaciecola sp. MH2013 TaxID=2785524 RepID=UPI00189CFE43|nr:inner membrane protein YiaA [Glaciecola sp. MH2013]MBF7074780.1 hypothetical protein [Glaciecola sp. MH2013]
MSKLVEAPTKAFRIAAIVALMVGGLSYGLGLFNADMMLNEKGYYLAVMLFGLFSAVSVQKSIRDKTEKIKTSTVYHLLSLAAAASSIALLSVGLYNAELLLSEKGFFGMSFVLSLFAAITVQKNVRDMQASRPDTMEEQKNPHAWTKASGEIHQTDKVDSSESAA